MTPNIQDLPLGMLLRSSDGDAVNLRGHSFLQMLYSIRSERLLIEEMDYNLLFRWFVGVERG